MRERERERERHRVSERERERQKQNNEALGRRTKEKHRKFRKQKGTINEKINKSEEWNYQREARKSTQSQ